MPLKLNSTGGGSVTLDTPSTAGTYTVTVPATNQTLGITSGTAVASTSGTSIDFTGIPSWVKRITVMLNGVSASGTSNMLIRIGSGSLATTGYSSCVSSGTGATNSTGSFPISANMAAASISFGVATICNISGNTWVYQSTIGNNTGGVANNIGAGQVTLSGVLDRLSVTVGTDTFDAGSINILYEG